MRHVTVGVFGLSERITQTSMGTDTLTRVRLRRDSPPWPPSGKTSVCDLGFG